jgi:hypothetical protein
VETSVAVIVGNLFVFNEKFDVALRSEFSVSCSLLD